METLLDCSDGTLVALHDLGGATGAPWLFVHATSFSAPTLGPLARALGGHRSFGLDLRGHGHSSVVEPDAFRWRSMADDVDAALSWLEQRFPGPVVGIGHSAGATALLLAAAANSDRFDQLYCYEPIALTDEIRKKFPLPRTFIGAARRRSRFESRGEALQYFGQRPPLSGLAPEVLRAYVDSALVDDTDGGLRLACAPEFEAAVYRAGYVADIYDLLGDVACPVAVAYGSDSEGFGLAGAPVVAEVVPNGRLLVAEGLGHLGPLDDPGRVAASVITAIETPES